MSFVHKHTLMILLIRAMGNTVVPFCGGATGRDPRRVPPDFKSGAVAFVSAIVRSVDSTVFCVSAWVFILSLMIVWRCLPRRSHRQRAPLESAVRRGNALKEIGPSSRPHSKKNLHHRLVLANTRRPGNIVLHIECVRCSRCGSGTILHPSAMDGHENGEEDHGVRDSVPWEVRCILKFVKESHEPIELPSSRCCFVGY